MGATSTKTRKLTIENEDPRSVIKVSDEVVQRLKGREEVRNKFPNVAPSPASIQAAPEGVPIYYYPGPIITSLQLRQERNQALDENDKYWEKRVSELQKSHDKIHEVMQCEYKRAMEELNRGTRTYARDIPCQETKEKVLDCYRKYRNETMKCAKEVQAFAECVDSQRASQIVNRG